MDPSTLPIDPRFLNVLAVPFTVAIVRYLSGALALTKTGKILAVLGVPAIATVALELAGFGLGWKLVPLVYIVATLSSAGYWTLQKNIRESAGSPR